ncbi:MAG TPA: trypsin-like peptidase domain-containing protein [Gemmatimonadaceae bacterium]|nr:trypsin-like peptidase domain-containing protein [Gemmatimonadaceae bacterium]
MSAAAVAAVAAAGHREIAGELEALATRLRESTVRIHTSRGRFDGVGAGVIWRLTSQSVAIVTNFHVVPHGRGDHVSVEGTRGRVVDGTVIARDREHDLALVTLDVTPDEVTGATLGSARTLRVGELVVAVGHPFGVAGSLSVGVVHAVPNGDEGLVRADIRLAPGNSGGPLATLDGAIVGINCMIARGLGIAIPAHVADRFVREALGVPT